jgi:signal transduction histidine kinase
LRQQHDLESSRHHEAPTGGHYDSLDAVPVSQYPAGTPSLADLAGLTQLLVAPMPVERTITVAIERAAQILASARRLALYALTPDVPAQFSRLVAAERDSSDALPRVNAESSTTATLGHGERADRRLLAERAVARTTGATLLPLMTSDDTLLGAFVVEYSPDAAPDATLLRMLADLLAPLLDRRLAVEGQRRAASAVRELATLAFAPTGDESAPQRHAATEAVSAEEAQIAAEQEAALLRKGAQELGAVAAAQACIALVRQPSGAWAALPDSDLPGDVSIPPAEAGALLPALREEPVSVTPEQNAALWSALAPLLLARDGAPGARIHLIAAASPQETYAIYALSESAAAPPAPCWLPLARALATAVAAGMAARRLAAGIRDEARARDAYISLAAHELRSPLTAIKGYAQLLMRQAQKQSLSESMQHSVEAIEQQSVRLSEMLGELLDASRVRRGILQVTTELVDLSAVLKRAVERRQAMFPQHTITVSMPEQPLTVVGDAARVEQVLRDLIDNGARYSPSGATISVTVGVPRAGEVLIAVRDMGIGVAPEDREHIFEYLFRAPRSEERNLSGLGLGLYVSRYLVERMGGRLWIESSSTEPPTGSEFHFTLPLA